jgi:hypothetical protein
MTAEAMATTATLETKARDFDAVLMIPHSPYRAAQSDLRLEPFDGRALPIASRNPAQPTR